MRNHASSSKIIDEIAVENWEKLLLIKNSLIIEFKINHETYLSMIKEQGNMTEKQENKQKNNTFHENLEIVIPSLRT